MKKLRDLYFASIESVVYDTACAMGDIYPVYYIKAGTTIAPNNDFHSGVFTNKIGTECVREIFEWMMNMPITRDIQSRCNTLTFDEQGELMSNESNECDYYDYKDTSVWSKDDGELNFLFKNGLKLKVKFFKYYKFSSNDYPTLFSVKSNWEIDPTKPITNDCGELRRKFILNSTMKYLIGKDTLGLFDEKSLKFQYIRKPSSDEDTDYWYHGAEPDAGYVNQ